MELGDPIPPSQEEGCVTGLPTTSLQSEEAKSSPHERASSPWQWALNRNEQVTPCITMYLTKPQVVNMQEEAVVGSLALTLSGGALGVEILTWDSTQWGG